MYKRQDIPLLGITLKADGGDMDVLSRIGMLSIQTADDRIFLPSALRVIPRSGISPCASKMCIRDRLWHGGVA